MINLANKWPEPEGSRRRTRAILAASVGNLLEWYDFSVYALFAIYIAANFCPHSDPGLDLVKAFLVFGLGFVIRPLGAMNGAA
jgi:MHS family proline/betaine transporter-like MFS transporter